jgi:hypothetical protein
MAEIIGSGYLSALGYGGASNSPTLGKRVVLNTPYAGGSAPQWGDRKLATATDKTKTNETTLNEVIKTLVEYQAPESRTSSAQAPGFDFPQFNIGIPDLSWSPTEGQRGTWLEEAIKRAALQIDPQVASREQGLSRFRNAADANRREINPRYDRMSSAVANIFKNVVDQALVNNAIRRGAAGSGVSSGWLGQERIKAGEEELGQRKGIENERNELLNAINAQVLGKEQETTDALGLLETLRGKQTDVSYADLERLARGDFLQEKQGTFENELQNAIFQGGYSTDQANFLLNKFNSESAASLGEAELALKGRETALNEAIRTLQHDSRNTGYSAEATALYHQCRRTGSAGINFSIPTALLPDTKSRRKRCSSFS